jgi:hypothetical protein
VRAQSASLDHDQRWQTELAAMLLGIGEMAPKKTAQDGDDSARNAFELVSRIPRLEGVARILLNQDVPFEESQRLAPESYPQGAWLMKLMRDWHRLCDLHNDDAVALRAIMFQANLYEPAILESFVTSHGGVDKALTCARTSRELRVGDTLVSGVFTKDGQLLLQPNEPVTEELVDRLTNFERLYELREPMFVSRAA